MKSSQLSTECVCVCLLVSLSFFAPSVFLCVILRLTRAQTLCSVCNLRRQLTSQVGGCEPTNQATHIQTQARVGWCWCNKNQLPSCRESESAFSCHSALSFACVRFRPRRLRRLRLRLRRVQCSVCACTRDANADAE